MSNGSVIFDLEFAIKGFQSSLKQAQNSFGIFTNDTKNKLKETEGATGKLSDSFSGKLTGSLGLANGAFASLGVTMFAANIAASAFQSGISLITNTVTGSLDAYAGSEEALNKLAQSMRLTGTYSAEASAQVESFASNLEANSKFADDAIVSQVAYARSLGLSTFQAEQLVQAAANMSATLGGGLDENVQKLGLTLDGTAGRLGKLIPELKNLTAEQLKAGAAAELINSKFAGAAANDLNTYAGKTAALANQYDNLQESIGGLIINSGIFQGLMTTIKNIVSATNSIFTTHIEKVKDVAISFGIVAGGIGAFIVVTNAAAIATAAFNAVMAITPWGLAATAVIAITFGIYKLIQNFDNLKVTALSWVRSFTEGILVAQEAVNKLLGIEIDTSFTRNQIKSLTSEIDSLNRSIADKKKAEDSPTAKASEASRTDKGPVDRTAEIAAANASLAAQRDLYAQREALKIANEQALNEIETAAANDRINSEITNNELSLAVKQEQYQTQLETRIAQEAEELVNRQTLQTQELDNILNHELAKAALIADSAEKKKALEEAQNKDALARATLNNKQQIEAATFSTKSQKALDDKAAADKKATLALKTQMEESYLNSARGYLGAAMSLAKSGSRESKALAITDATIATYLGATKAFASVPFPANFIAAGSVIAGGLANIAKITSAGSFANGGFIGGSSFSGDKLQANVNSGEAVLNVSQQKEFMRIANGNGGGNETLLERLAGLEAAILSRPMILIADDTEIARSASRGVQNGIEIGRSR